MSTFPNASFYGVPAQFSRLQCETNTIVMMHQYDSKNSSEIMTAIIPPTHLYHYQLICFYVHDTSIQSAYGEDAYTHAFTQDFSHNLAIVTVSAVL